MVDPLNETFPNLARGGHLVTSERASKYNCIAWAAGDSSNWWWPIPDAVKEAYWPAATPREETLASFQQAFASLGYVPCDGEEVEVGFEKIALFADPQGIPQHAARQLPGGRWTSKLGELEDIEHDLRDLEGTAYGSVVVVMKRAARS